MCLVGYCVGMYWCSVGYIILGYNVLCWVYYIRLECVWLSILLELAVACCFATGPMSLNQHNDEVSSIYLGKLDIIQYFSIISIYVL